MKKITLTFSGLFLILQISNINIRYGSLQEQVYPDSITGRVLFGNEFPFSNVYITSASYRSSSNTVVATFVPPDKSFFITSMLSYSHGNFGIDLADTIYVTQDPMPSVDDVVIRSCAVCWCDNGTIYYAQNKDGIFVNGPIPVSDIAVSARQPNVCYKTFNEDYFDVIWLEGDTPPYRIMYRRMKKIYLSVNDDDQKKFEFPQKYALLQNYPNPFNPETEITYQLPQNSNLELTIFNLQGQKIKTLFSGRQSAGTHQMSWNGLDENGNPVASGVYLCQMRTGQFVKARKMLLLR